MLAGELVANRLRARPGLRMILPTGHTPLGMYAALRGHAADGSLPSERATLFQLDEYLGLGADSERSYRAYLRRELAGVRLGCVHNIDGAAPDPDAECARHQALLDEAPVDLAVLGLGRDGHVAFDEPGSPPHAGVRRVELHAATRADAAPDFGGIDGVPREAFTVGLRTLLAAHELLLLVTGEAKAEALKAALEGPKAPAFPASMLRDHPRITIVCDLDARLLRPRPGGDSDRAVIVLGHREPPDDPRHRISDESLVRVERAVRLCEDSAPRAVIFTGYSRTQDGVSEAEQMKAKWPLRRIPAVLEQAGRNTAENASRSLPLIRAIGDISRVTVVTSAWHFRAPYFFAPYRALGLGLSFAPAYHRPWVAPLAHEIGELRDMRSDRRRAMAAMRLPAEPGLHGAGEAR